VTAERLQRSGNQGHVQQGFQFLHTAGMEGALHLRRVGAHQHVTLAPHHLELRAQQIAHDDVGAAGDPSRPALRLQADQPLAADVCSLLGFYPWGKGSTSSLEPRRSSPLVQDSHCGKAFFVV